MPRAFPLFWDLTMDARKTGAGAFYTGILYHMEIPCETFLVDNTGCCLSDLGHFLQLCSCVLFFVLVQSLRDLFFWSSGKTSFHDNSWGLSIYFFTYTQAFFIPKLPSWWSSPSFQQCLLSNDFTCTTCIRSQAFTHYVRREWCLKFLVRQQTNTKKIQTSWKMTHIRYKKHGQHSMQ